MKVLLTGVSSPVAPLFVLYGSATGNAEHIAKDLASTYESYLRNQSFLGYFPSVVCCELNQYKKRCLDIWETRPHPVDDSVRHGVCLDFPVHLLRLAQFGLVGNIRVDGDEPVRHAAFIDDRQIAFGVFGGTAAAFFAGVGGGVGLGHKKIG